MKNEIEINEAIKPLEISMPIVDHSKFDKPLDYNGRELVGFAIFEAATFGTLEDVRWNLPRGTKEWASTTVHLTKSLISIMQKLH